MEVNSTETTLDVRRKQNDAGFFIPELVFMKIQRTNSHIKLLRQLAQRAAGEQIILTACALEETLSLIESELDEAIEKAQYLTE